jgi:ATP-binding cassette, subfamily B, bacterial
VKEDLSNDTRLSAGLWSIARLMSPHKKRLTIGLLLSLASTGFALVQPILAGQVVGLASSDESFAATVGLLIAVVVIYACVDALSGFVLETTGQAIVKSLRLKLCAHLLAMPMSTIGGFRLGDLISRTTVDACLVRKVASESLVRFFSGIVALIGAAVLMLLVDPLLCMVVLVCLGAAFLIMTLTTRRFQSLAMSTQEDLGVVSADLERALSDLRTVKANRTERAEFKRLQQSVHSAYKHSFATARLRALGNPVVRIAVYGSSVVILLVGSIRVSSGQIPLADLITIMLYSLYVSAPVGDMYESVTEFQGSLGALRRIEEVLGTEPEHVDRPIVGVPEKTTSGLAHRGFASRDLMPDSPGLRFNSVTFSYGHGRNVLDGATFAVAAGAHVGLVGPSGSGKSTVFSLVCRLYDPDEGRIAVNGINLQSISIGESRSLVGLLDQNAPLLYGSVRENLSYGNGEVSHEEVDAIVDRVNLRGVLQRLPDGLDSQLGEHGNLVSGGERQRIALARTLLRKPAVLLLDEPTAMLDSASEVALIRLLDDVKTECTLLTISHRRSTLKLCDSFLVVNDGLIDHVASLEDVETRGLHEFE